jgi:hypothetical protein
MSEMEPIGTERNRGQCRFQCTFWTGWDRDRGCRPHAENGGNPPFSAVPGPLFQIREICERFQMVPGSNFPYTSIPYGTGATGLAPGTGPRVPILWPGFLGPAPIGSGGSRAAPPRNRTA